MTFGRAFAALCVGLAVLVAGIYVTVEKDIEQRDRDRRVMALPNLTIPHAPAGDVHRQADQAAEAAAEEKRQNDAEEARKKREAPKPQPKPVKPAVEAPAPKPEPAPLPTVFPAPVGTPEFAEWFKNATPAELCATGLQAACERS
ncbi:hypothetical protein ABZV77_11465 [Streptomyces sp. NPDC004732]|uniref:hypothetical protein n=1 Tax=Streptomyces sp. NPDC004732 TaxID=3154290 RepID=UPI0033BB7D5E